MGQALMVEGDGPNVTAEWDGLNLKAKRVRPRLMTELDGPSLTSEGQWAMLDFYRKSQDLHVTLTA